jgi:hypothetical protein
MSLWGEHHIRNTSGPRAPTGQPARRTIARLRLHEVEPGDLAIDPDYPAGRAPDALGVDLTRLGIIPPAARGSRR